MTRGPDPVELARVIEFTTDAVMLAGLDSQIRYLNPSARRLLGIRADGPVEGGSLEHAWPERLRAGIARDSIAMALAEGSCATETHFAQPDGNEVPVTIVIVRHPAAGGLAASLSLTARDMTEQTALRDALSRARDDAERATAAKSTFLANTSHEIRTPLNGILGMVELLLDTELTPDQRRSASLIASSGDTLLNTINDVLDVSKIEARQIELDIVPIDLPAVIHSATRLFTPAAQGRGIELVEDIGDDVPMCVSGDPHRLRQVLSNLVGNAVKFTHVGEVVVSVRATAAAAGARRVAFSVRDSGVGIAADKLALVFEPFQQADNSTTRFYGGTGLGLTIARRLVDLMGGVITLSSELGKGSEFRFALEMPLAEAPPAAQLSPEPVAGLRLLLVDDHPINRLVLEHALVSAGCAVTVADSAVAGMRELVDAAARAPFALLISDVQMPGRDGFQLAADVRADVRTTTTPIVLLSSGGQPGDVARCRELGVAAYLQKPASRAELIDAARTAVFSDALAPQRAIPRGSAVEPARVRLRVLLADDNEVNQVVAAAMLRKRGHTVAIADDGRKAVAAFRADGPFDVVLMDLQMPELDGYEATMEIRRLDSLTRIIALSATIDEEERARCLAAGMNDFLSKPFKSSELFAMVEKRHLA